MAFHFHFKPLKWLIIAKQILVILIIGTGLYFVLHWALSSPSSLPVMPSKELAPNNNTQAPSKINFKEIVVLHNNIEPSKLLLSHLEDALLFLGVSERPDKNPQKNKIILSLKNSLEEIKTFDAGDKIFISTERDLENGGLIFHFNEPHASVLWIQAAYKEGKLFVEVGSDKDGLSIKGDFTLNKAALPSRKTSLQINSVRIDPAYLTRKQAKWIGKDLFLERHGGDIFSQHSKKERIDFAEGYSCFVQTGSFLIWKDNCWQVAVQDTENEPLLYVKSISEKLMHFEFWPPEGDTKCVVTLAKYPELHCNTSHTVQLFRYLGAKSWKEFLFEIAGKRVYLRKNDWLLHTEKEWKRLVSPEDIDLYVTGTLKGELIIIDGVKRIKGNQMLVGHAFNTTRTKMWDIEIPMKQKSTPFLKESQKKSLETSEIDFEDPALTPDGEYMPNNRGRPPTND